MVCFCLPASGGVLSGHSSSSLSSTSSAHRGRLQHRIAGSSRAFVAAPGGAVGKAGVGAGGSGGGSGKAGVGAGGSGSGSGKAGVGAGGSGTGSGKAGVGAGGSGGLLPVSPSKPVSPTTRGRRVYSLSDSAKQYNFQSSDRTPSQKVSRTIYSLFLADFPEKTQDKALFQRDPQAAVMKQGVLKGLLERLVNLYPYPNSFMNEHISAEVLSIADQGRCASCWAHSAVTMFETALRRSNRYSKPISVQQVKGGSKAEADKRVEESC